MGNKGLNLGLSIHGSSNRLDIISKCSQQIQEKYEESKENGFDKKFTLGDKIGEGMHATVHKCFDNETN